MRCRTSEPAESRLAMCAPGSQTQMPSQESPSTTWPTPNVEREKWHSRHPRSDRASHTLLGRVAGAPIAQRKLEVKGQKSMRQCAHVREDGCRGLSPIVRSFLNSEMILWRLIHRLTDRFHRVDLPGLRREKALLEDLVAVFRAMQPTDHTRRTSRHLMQCAIQRGSVLFLYPGRSKN